MRWVVAAIALTGCQAVFPLDEFVEPTCLDDRFDNNLATNWAVVPIDSADSEISLTDTGGTAVFTFPDPPVSIDDYVYLESIDTYDLTEAALEIVVAEVPTQSTEQNRNIEAGLFMFDIDGNEYDFFISANNLILRDPSGQQNDVYLPYPMEHYTHWRIRSEGDQVVFEAGLDGIVWTDPLRQATPPAPLTSMRVGAFAGYFGGGLSTGNPGAFRVDSITVTSPSCQ